MQKDELLALAERVEALSGPDREADARIAVVIRYAYNAAPFVDLEACQSVTDEDEWNVICRVNGQKTDRYSPPRYTASLDAAMSLVPCKSDNEVGFSFWPQHRAAPTAGLIKCQLWHIDGFQNYAPGGVPEATAGTHILALCAAALRALAGGE